MLINDNFWSRVSKEQNNLTKKEHGIIKYINLHSQKMDKITISSLAKANNVGYSVVYNLIKKLGFNGYRDFVISLAAQETTFQALNREFFGDRHALKEYYKKLIDLNDSTINYEQLKDFAKWMDEHSKSNIYVAGVGHSGLAAEDLSVKLYRFGFHPVLLNKDGDSTMMQASMIDSDDALVVFTLSGQTVASVEAARLAKEKGALVIAITAFESSNINKYANQVFHVVSADFHQDEAIQISPLFALIYFNDLLVNYLLNSSNKNKYLDNWLLTNKVVKKF